VGPILAESQRDASERAERAASAARNVPGPAETEREAAARELEAAAAAQAQASAAAEREDAPSAASAAAEAQAALQRAQSAMKSARAASAAARETENKSLESLRQEQEALAREAEALKDAAEKAGLDPEAQKAAQDALEQASEAMSQAASSMASGKPSEASSSQARASEALESAAAAARSGAKPKSEADRAEVERLEKEQARIRAELLKLAQRNKNREGAKPSNSMENAASSAKRAEEALGDEELQEAEQAEIDAERQMREAQRELGAEEEQYQRLRQEELLFKIAEQVKALTDEHQVQMRATVEIDAQRKPGERPSHTSRLRLRKIAKAEEQLAARATDIGKSIREEQSVVFAEVLDQAARDLTSIGRDMSEAGDWQSGERVQARQQDVEQSWIWLGEALQQEKQRRQEQPPGQPQEQQQQQAQNRLVPDVAELKLLRRMGVDVTEEIERLRILNPEIENGSEIDPLLREDIGRLGFRHERVSDLFRQFRSRLGIPAPAEENP